jgi:hypothetical protein
LQESSGHPTGENVPPSSYSTSRPKSSSGVHVEHFQRGDDLIYGSHKAGAWVDDRGSDRSQTGGKGDPALKARALDTAAAAERDGIPHLDYGPGEVLVLGVVYGVEKGTFNPDLPDEGRPVLRTVCDLVRDDKKRLAEAGVDKPVFALTGTSCRRLRAHAYYDGDLDALPTPAEAEQLERFRGDVRLEVLHPADRERGKKGDPKGRGRRSYRTENGMDAKKAAGKHVGRPGATPARKAVALAELGSLEPYGTQRWKWGKGPIHEAAARAGVKPGTLSEWIVEPGPGRGPSHKEKAEREAVARYGPRGKDDGPRGLQVALFYA